MALILIVDDEEENRELVSEILEMAGHKVTSAPDWVKGNTIIIREKPDLVLLDINMPGIKGDRILEVLQETIKNLPKIVFYSGMDESELQKKAWKHKANGYIQKGTSMDEFVRKVETILKS